MIVDLGSGYTPRGDINFDILPNASIGVIGCNLGFERIPLDNNVADKVTAYHFVEHVPFYIYLSKTEKYSPIHFLFEEVLRILKPGGIFFIQVPLYPSSIAFQDPEHLSFWTEQTAVYLTTGHPSGVFEIVLNKKVAPSLLEITFRKKK